MNSKKIGKTSKTGTTTKSKKVKMTFPVETPSKGLGDTVEKVTKKTGIKKAVKWLLGDDCGCDKRKDYLNQLFPYKRPECLREDEYLYLKNWYSVPRSVVSPDQQLRLLEINNRVFREVMKPCGSCGSAFAKMLDRLEKVYNQYK